MSDVVGRALAALNAHDIDAFLGCYAPDATIEDGDDVVIACGHDELRTRYSAMFVALPDVRVEAVARTDVGSFVVQEECVVGRALASERHVAVYRIADDAIVRERLLR